MQRWKCEWVEEAVICGMWWMIDCGWGVLGILGTVMSPVLAIAMTSTVGGREKKARRINGAKWPGVEEGKRDESKAGEKNVDRPALMCLWSKTKDTAGGVGGCRGGNGIIYLSSLSLTLILLSFLPSFPSFPASVLLFLASRGSVVKASKQRRLFISASGE